MVMSNPLELQVLNTTSDDIENLEQIYRSLSLEFSSQHFRPDDPTAFYWRAAHDGPSLADIANSLRSLIEKGLLEVRTEDGRSTNSLTDLSVIWSAWFRATPAGRNLAVG